MYTYMSVSTVVMKQLRASPRGCGPDNLDVEDTGSDPKTRNGRALESPFLGSLSCSLLIGSPRTEASMLLSWTLLDEGVRVPGL